MTSLHLSRTAIRLALALGPWLAGTAAAQLPPGGDGYAFPAGGAAGGPVDVRLGGADWTPDVQFFFHDPRVKLELLTRPGGVLIHDPPYWFDIKSFANDPKLPREVSARFHLPAGLPPGPVRWSVANANGGGPGGVFVVGTGGEVTEDEQRAGPQDLPALPATVNGRLRRIEEVDRYRFRAAEGGLVHCEVAARRLGHDFYAVVEVFDGDRKVAEAADTEGTDPSLTFLAEKGRAYTVAVRDIDHRGYRNFTYRLHLTTGPRVVTALPPAGRRGETRPVEFIGFGIRTGQPVLERVTAEVTFPSGPDGDSFPYRLRTAFGTAPAYSLLLGDGPERVEPTAAGPVPLAAPGSVSGRFARRGERHVGLFTGKKGETWELTVRAKSIGSPVEPALTVSGPDGKPLPLKDTADGGPDARGVLTLPADGEYRAVVADTSGKPPGPDAVFRLTARRPAGGFHLRTTGVVNVPVGGKGSLKVDLVRDGGFTGPVTLTIEGLPEGVSAAKDPVIGPTATALAVALDCAKTAPAKAGFVRVVGTATVDGRGVRTSASATHGDDFAPAVLVATTLKPPFKVKVAEADGGRRVPRGSTHPAEILVERADGFAGEIVLDMAGNQQRHRQGIRGPAVAVPPGQTRVAYPVFLPEWLETTRTSRLGLVATAKVPDPQGTVRYVADPVQGQITLSIEGALLKLSHAADEIAVPCGRPYSLPLKLARSPRLPGRVAVELVVPAELAGLVSAAPFDWPAQAPSAALAIVTRADPKLVGTRKLTARATATRDGLPVVSETEFEIEFLPPAAGK